MTKFCKITGFIKDWEAPKMGRNGYPYRHVFIQELNGRHLKACLFNENVDLVEHFTENYPPEQVFEFKGDLKHNGYGREMRLQEILPAHNRMKRTKTPEELVFTAKAAQMMGVSEDVFLYHARMGDYPFSPFKNGNKYLWRKKDIASFLISDNTEACAC